MHWFIYTKLHLLRTWCIDWAILIYPTWRTQPTDFLKAVLFTFLVLFIQKLSSHHNNQQWLTLIFLYQNSGLMILISNTNDNETKLDLKHFTILETGGPNNKAQKFSPVMRLTSHLHLLRPQSRLRSIDFLKKFCQSASDCIASSHGKSSHIWPSLEVCLGLQQMYVHEAVEGWGSYQDTKRHGFYSTLVKLVKNC